MPTSHSPSLISLLSFNIHSAPPVCDWIRSVATEHEMAAFLLAIQGIPPAWLEWVEEKVKSLESRDREIHSRVGYALSTLWMESPYYKNASSYAMFSRMRFVQPLSATSHGIRLPMFSSTLLNISKR